MKLEPRYSLDENRVKYISAAILICESEAESLIIDEAFGDIVQENGLIANINGEVRLSDGYGPHYILLKRAE